MCGSVPRHALEMKSFAEPYSHTPRIADNRTWPLCCPPTDEVRRGRAGGSDSPLLSCVPNFCIRYGRCGWIIQRLATDHSAKIVHRTHRGRHLAEESNTKVYRHHLHKVLYTKCWLHRRHRQLNCTQFSALCTPLPSLHRLSLYRSHLNYRSNHLLC